MRGADPRRDVHAVAAVVARVGARWNPLPVCRPILVGAGDLGVERALDRDRGLAPFGLSKAAKKPSPVRLTISPPCRRSARAGPRRGERAALPLFVAERLEQLGRVDDVGEDERPARLEPPEALVHALLVQLRPEALERRERRLELGGRRVLVADGTRAPAASARARSRTEHQRLASRHARALETGRCSIRVALRELDLPRGEVDDRIERRRSALADCVRVDDPFESSSIAARAVFRSPAAIAISICAGSAAAAKAGPGCPRARA